MERHRTDLVALFFGLAFLAVGAGFIVHETTGRTFDASWVAAIALVSIGCIFLGVTLLRGARSSSRAPEVATAPETAGAAADRPGPDGD